MTNKLIQFGAGNIGRSFIGKVFSQSGYEVVFVDVDETIINHLNKHGQYTVISRSDGVEDRAHVVENVRAINAKDKAAVIEEIYSASIIATSVGAKAMRAIMPLIGGALERRRGDKTKGPIDIIIAENIRNGANLLRSYLANYVDTSYLQSHVGLVETSIGKMVPIITPEMKIQDPLLLIAEPYNHLIVDKKGFKGPIPAVTDLDPVRNIMAFVDRKLFIHNLGHAAAAYLGSLYLPHARYIYEVVEDPAILRKIRRCMVQSAMALWVKYPYDLPMDDLVDHIEDLLSRFRNRSLKDTIFRVGRDLSRKLGKEDRLVAALLLALERQYPVGAIAEAIAAAFVFNARDHEGERFGPDGKVINLVNDKDIETAIKEICGLDNTDRLEASAIDQILKAWNKIHNHSREPSQLS